MDTEVPATQYKLCRMDGSQWSYQYTFGVIQEDGIQCYYNEIL